QQRRSPIESAAFYRRGCVDIWPRSVGRIPRIVVLPLVARCVDVRADAIGRVPGQRVPLHIQRLINVRPDSIGRIPREPVAPHVLVWIRVPGPVVVIRVSCQTESVTWESESVRPAKTVWPTVTVPGWTG